MAKLSRPRHGSLQFWPRKRAEKALGRVNWSAVKGKGILGFITYKVGMGSVLVKDLTPNSMTLNKKIIIPVTILETPNMRIFSVRFYKYGRVLKDFIVSKDKELKRKLGLPKEIKELKVPEDYDDVRAIFYSVVGETGIKKTPDLMEIAVDGDSKEKRLEFIKSFIGKDISIGEFLKNELVDVRGLTKGKGLVGPVKRFGLTLKSHKSEKGVRRPGSLGPWHPARVTYLTPMAGQLGMFSRVHYNLKLVTSGKIAEKNINPASGFSQYGNIKTSYVILYGSVQGPQKRQVLITSALRPTKKQAKKKYEFLELLR